MTVFCGMPRFCGEQAIAPRPIVPPAIVETHLSWRRAGLNAAMRRFVEASERVGRNYVET